MKRNYVSPVFEIESIISDTDIASGGYRTCTSCDEIEGLSPGSPVCAAKYTNEVSKFVIIGNTYHECQAYEELCNN